MSYSAYSLARTAARLREALAEGEGHYEDCAWETDPMLCDCEQRAEEAYWDEEIDKEMER